MNVMAVRCENLGYDREGILVIAKLEHELEKCDGIRFLGVVGVSIAESFKLSKYTIKRWVRAPLSTVIHVDFLIHILSLYIIF